MYICEQTNIFLNLQVYYKFSGTIIYQYFKTATLGLVQVTFT